MKAHFGPRSSLFRRSSRRRRANSLWRLTTRSWAGRIVWTRSKAPSRDPRFRALPNAKMPTSGRIALDASGEAIVAGQYNGVVDVQVHLPVPASSVQANGFYRRALGVPVFVPEALRAVGVPILVRARSSDQSADQTPIDQVLLDAGEDLPLYLPPGHNYVLVAHRADGSIVDQIRLDVE